MGAEKKNMVMTDEDKRVTAYHEAGHTLLAVELKTDPIHKVTIIPRGRALGVTQTLPSEDRMNLDRTKALNLISFMMGGRAAEEMVFNQITTGAGNDIERATDLARRMVCEWGMSEVLGPINFGGKEDPIFVGRDINSSRSFSESTAQTIDREIRKIVDDSYRRAKEVLSDKRHLLDNLSAALLEYETIDGEDVLRICGGNKIEREAPPTKFGTAKVSSKETKVETEKKMSEPGGTPVPSLA
jgi:cell division protease FtsH